jgi:internalin A
MNELWADLDRGLHEHFLDMMDQFDLSYRVESGHHGEVSLVVERLPWNPPPKLEDKWPTNRPAGSNEIKVIYSLNTTPPGIPTWFIARSHRFSTNTHWRTGALMAHPDRRHTALVRADRHRNTIELSVRGPSPANFFSILDDGLNRTLERFPGLEIERQVPCPCSTDDTNPCPERFDYVNLQGRLERTPPRHEIECHRSGEQVSIPHLIHGIVPTDRDVAGAKLERLTKTLERLDNRIDEHGAYNQRMFLKLLHQIQVQQESRCPSVLAIVPAGRRKLTRSAFEVRLYCEEPGAWHRLPEPEGCYDISQPANWFRKFGPYLEYLLKASSMRHH